MKNELYGQLEDLKSCDKNIRSLVDEIERNHFNSLSVASHEMMNKLSFIASSHQLITMKHPEVCEYPFWTQMGSTISDFMRYLERLSLCRYIHIPQPDNISLDDILYSLHDYMDDAFPDNDNELVYDTPCSFCLYADYTHLLEALKCLLFNACEAILSNEQNENLSQQEYMKKIFIKTETVCNSKNIPCVSISITNYGTIENLSQASKCDIFYTTKPNHTGTGLYVANTVCQKHKGSFLLTTAKGYTTATMLLPATVTI